MSILVIKDGPLAGRRVPVDAEKTIGRERADVLIEDPEASPPHAAVRPVADGLEIEDLGSTNGTFVNGSRIADRVRLNPGDVIRIGGTSIEVEEDRETAAPGQTVMAPAPAPPPPPPAPLPSQWSPPAQPVPGYVPPPAYTPPPAPRRRKGVLIGVALVLVAVLVAAAGIVVFPNLGDGDTQSKAALIAEADRVCATGAQRVSNINFNDDADAAALSEDFDRALRITRRMARDLRALTPPDMGQDDYQAFLDSLDRVNREVVTFIEALEGDNIAAVPQASEELTRAGDRYQEAARAFGFPESRNGCLQATGEL